MLFIVEIVISALLVAGGIFGLIGSFGLLKLPDQMTRLHGPTKAVTLGVGGVLIASMLWFAFFTDSPSWHELLITLFLLLTAPVTGYMIAKTNMHLTWRRQDLPDPGPGRHWATYADAQERSLMDEAQNTDDARPDHRE